jgi:hypothetical protein
MANVCGGFDLLVEVVKRKEDSLRETDSSEGVFEKVVVLE